MYRLRRSTPYSRLALLFALMFVCYFIFGMLMVSVFPAISGGYTLDKIEDPALWGNPSFAFAFKVFQFLYTTLVFLVPAGILAWLASPKPGEYLGLERPVGVIQLGLVILIMLCALPMVGLLNEWNQTWNLPKSLMDVEEAAKTQTEMLLKMPDLRSMLTNLLLIALAPAIAEEVMFRGVMQKIITQLVKNGWVAALITAVIFSAVHLQFLGFMPRVLLGFLLGAIYYTTGNLWLSIAAHVLNNGLQVVLIYLYQVKMTNYDAMADEHVPLYFGLLSALVSGLLIWRLYNRSKQNGYRLESLAKEPEFTTTEKEY
ncbi:CPBP family intramembrane glutamic endopeptidase [Chitinophaga barathri]|uniref:CPBP family intramembrane metalloprotease n=1 Tax=Chitinophaga barathri TaxID=1647451 RepID=A0A3N4M5Y4_9BACT|nr:type II CAAX endopeptidase family protein [Chitinophaga barathri]RPD38465.1 CPBP family intramembrane metalloprotease [Chitinophaga barathri]